VEFTKEIGAAIVYCVRSLDDPNELSRSFKVDTVLSLITLPSHFSPWRMADGGVSSLLLPHSWCFVVAVIIIVLERFLSFLLSNQTISNRTIKVKGFSK
jgi:hypothetical protein